MRCSSSSQNWTFGRIRSRCPSTFHCSEVLTLVTCDSFDELPANYNTRNYKGISLDQRRKICFQNERNLVPFQIRLFFCFLQSCIKRWNYITYLSFPSMGDSPMITEARALFTCWLASPTKSWITKRNEIDEWRFLYDLLHTCNGVLLQNALPYVNPGITSFHKSCFVMSKHEGCPLT